MGRRWRRKTRTIPTSRRRRRRRNRRNVKWRNPMARAGRQKGKHDRKKRINKKEKLEGGRARATPLNETTKAAMNNTGLSQVCWRLLKAACRENESEGETLAHVLMIREIRM